MVRLLAAVREWQIGVRVRSLAITLAMSGRGNHTNYSWELLRVDVRVNAGATQGYLSIRGRSQIDPHSQEFSNRINVLTPILSPCIAWRGLRVERAMGIEPTWTVLPEGKNKRVGAMANSKCE
jgi:hypothetical protein